LAVRLNVSFLEQAISVLARVRDKSRLSIIASL